MKKLSEKVVNKMLKKCLLNYLSKELIPANPYTQHLLEDMNHNLQIGDVILVAGRSRVSSVIAYLTHSMWTHAALYIGCISDFKGTELYDQLCTMFDCVDTQLIVESLSETGYTISPLDKYKNDLIRVCRPKKLKQDQHHELIKLAIEQLNMPYDIRHVIDLLRFLLPWRIIPRKWHSSIFTFKICEVSKMTCGVSTARVFMRLGYPILPEIELQNNQVILNRRQLGLFVPKDFDLSPYFDIIKPDPKLYDLQ